MKRRFSTRAAFSLVEVALAMGIFAFCMIALLGILPAALGASRKSLDFTTSSHVAEMVSSRIQQNGAQVDSSQNFHFDDEGNETAADSAIYHATVECRSAGSASLLLLKIAVFRNVSSEKLHFSYLIFNP
jgi:uncharacterized protein (TIGR02598 family)